ncbi:metal ABC transporter solute-binding protein, Zn/Mn family [Halovivax gelatinilyticus]|uniref:metal ABC transporter solute-binding protein, Zn/Mn family n=1 Tax=Halovivax gelatinilyticus TaxID=2961597 RepID=UPI0020CA3904|nr:zinc ABC transporter substrate-binding protein [Halovivax gelatinilyticus]
MELTRRSVLSAAAGTGAASLVAGCLSDPPGFGSDPEGGYAAFYALWDWAEQVSGDEMSFENPVDVGEMGHGWEPSASLPADVAQSAAFIYLDTPEFSWAQDLARELETDHEDVALIDVMEGLEPQLLVMDEDDGADREADPESAFDPEHLTVDDFDVYDTRSGERIMYWHDGHWHGGVPSIEVDSSVTVEPVVIDESDRVLPLDDDSAFELDAVVADGAQEGIVDIEASDGRITFSGTNKGLTRIYYRVLHDGSVIWDTSNDLASVEVVAELEATDRPSFYDPHVWVDPVLAEQMVETIADGLSEVDPDNEGTYRENAEDYQSRVADVHDQFKALETEATRDVALFIGHDSFGYIDARYDFDIHTSVGISADADETGADVAELVELIETHDIETVLYDPFETPNPDTDVPDAVEVILESSEATNYEPLTPVEGTTPEWNDAGYGWVEQMEQVNLPSLRKALGVKQ